MTKNDFAIFQSRLLSAEYLLARDDIANRDAIHSKTLAITIKLHFSSFSACSHGVHVRVSNRPFHLGLHQLTVELSNVNLSSEIEKNNKQKLSEKLTGSPKHILKRIRFLCNVQADHHELVWLIEHHGSVSSERKMSGALLWPNVHRGIQWLDDME